MPRRRGPPAAIVHDLEQAGAALAAAAHCGRKVRLLTPPGGAHYAGAAHYAEVLRLAAASWPAARFQAVLDCGDDAALALDSIAAGWRALVLERHGRAFAAVADVAGRAGAVLLRRAPVAVDLGLAADPAAAAVAWLAEIEPRRRLEYQK